MASDPEKEMDPNLVIEALQHMKDFYDIEETLVEKIIDSYKKTACAKLYYQSLHDSVKNKLEKFSNRFEKSIKNEFKIVKEKEMIYMEKKGLEKKMNSLKGVNMKLLNRVTNMEKRFQHQEHRKDELRLKSKYLEEENVNLRKKIITLENKETTIRSEEKNMDSVMVIMNKKNEDEDCVKILKNKIKEQEKLLEKKLYVA
jgi:hypothetical protein